MACGKIRHMFPGGNTSLGFFSYYNNIIGQDDADRIFIIKGGPGVGKSTFMKKIGAQLLEIGYDVEFFHCSSDNNSLDGVMIPKLGVAFMDGTAPHVMEPRNPGAVDEILNFGEFWNGEGIREHKAEILDINRDIAGIFARTYKYLNAARSIWDNSADIYSSVVKNGEINRLADELINELFAGIPTSVTAGKQRSMFASAITPNGLCNYLDSLITAQKVYCIIGGMGTGEENVLDKIRAAALAKGFYTEVYYCALKPDKPEHLIIPALDTAFTTHNAYHNSSADIYKCFDMSEYMDAAVIESHRSDLEQNREEFERLLYTAISTLNRAKTLHDRLETFYVPNICFSDIGGLLEKILSQILK